MKEHREGAQPGVHQRVARVLPPARIGKLLEGPADLFRNVVQRQDGATKRYAIKVLPVKVGTVMGPRQLICIYHWKIYRGKCFKFRTFACNKNESF